MNSSVLIFKIFWSWPLVKVFGIADSASKESKFRKNQGNHDEDKRSDNFYKEKKSNQYKEKTTWTCRRRSLQGEDDYGKYRQSDVEEA